MGHYCKEHPRYEAKRKPGSICGRCWELYFLRNPEEKRVAIESYAELEKMREDFTGQDLPR